MKSETFKNRFWILLALAISGCASSVELDRLLERGVNNANGENVGSQGEGGISPSAWQGSTACFDLEGPIDDATLTIDAVVYDCDDLTGTALIVYCEQGCQRVCGTLPPMPDPGVCEVALLTDSLKPATSEEGDGGSAEEPPVNESEPDPEDPAAPTGGDGPPTGEGTDPVNTHEEDPMNGGNAMAQWNPGNADNQCPAVTTTSPTDNATGVSGGSLIYCFDEPMAANSFETNQVTCKPDCTVTSASYSQETACVQYTLLKSLVCGTDYKVTLSATPTDASGNPLCEAVTINFSTKKCASGGGKSGK